MGAANDTRKHVDLWKESMRFKISWPTKNKATRLYAWTTCKEISRHFQHADGVKPTIIALLRGLVMSISVRASSQQ